jgi:hypothetical protein
MTTDWSPELIKSYRSLDITIDDRTIRARKFASQIMAILGDTIADWDGAESRLIHAAYDADVEIVKTSTLRQGERE